MDQEVTLIEFETVDDPVDTEPVELLPQLQRFVDDHRQSVERAVRPWGSQLPKEELQQRLAEASEKLEMFDGSSIPVDSVQSSLLYELSNHITRIADALTSGVNVPDDPTPTLQRLQQSAPQGVRFEPGVGSRLRIGPFKAAGYNEEFDFDFGEYDVYLQVNRHLDVEECRAYPLDDGIYREDHPHPHVNTSHVVCLGEAKHLVKSNVKSGHLELIPTLVGNVLSSFDPGDEYLHIGYWVESANCVECGRHIIPDQERVCHSTGHEGCDNCLVMHDDGEWYRTDQLIYCDCCSLTMVRDNVHAEVFMPVVHTHREWTAVSPGDEYTNGGAKKVCSPSCETYYAQRAASVLTTYPSVAEIDSRLDGTPMKEDANEEEPQEADVQEVGLEIEFLT